MKKWRLTKKEILLKVITIFAIMGMIIAPALAHIKYAEEGTRIESALDNIINWLTRVLGAGLVIIGLIFTGIRMSMHDPDAIKKGAWVIIGGILIFLARNILGLLRQLAGR